MKLDKKLFDHRWKSITLALCTAILFYVIIAHLSAIGDALSAIGYFIYPVFLGVVVAYIMDPLVKVFERYVFFKLKTYRMRRSLSVLCAIILVVAGIVFLMVGLIPQFVDSVMGFFGNIENYVLEVQKWLDTLQAKSAQSGIDFSKILTTGSNMLDSLLDKLPRDMDSIVNSAVSVGKNVMSWIIGCIIAIYFLLDKQRLLNWFKRLFRACMKEKTYNNSAVFWGRCNRILIRFVICDLIDALIIGVANAVFMTIARMPYVVLISVVVGVTNLAPTFGPIVGGVIGALILVLENPWSALWFIIFTIILQTIDGYVLKPKLFGTLLGVSGVWILICIVVGGRIFGVPGVLLAIPFAAIMSFVYNEFILVKLDERHRKREAAEAEQEAEESGEVTEETEETKETKETKKQK